MLKMSTEISNPHLHLSLPWDHSDTDQHFHPLCPENGAEGDIACPLRKDPAPCSHPPEDTHTPTHPPTQHSAMPGIPAGFGYMKSVSGSPQEAQLQGAFSPIGGHQGREGPAGGSWAGCEGGRGPGSSRVSIPLKSALLWKEQQPWRGWVWWGNPEETPHSAPGG